MKSNITFVIIAYNEEKRIEYPIKCFLPYGDVIVSDDNSTDDTVKIVKRLGAAVIKRQTHGVTFVVENKKEFDFIFSHVKTDWVFIGFVDDLIPKTCLELYTKISHENKYKIVVQKRKTLLYDGKSEFHNGLICIKLFRKDSIDFANNTMHQMGKFADHVKHQEVLYLPPIDEYAAYHFALETTQSCLRKMNNYIPEQAKSIKGKVSALNIFFCPMITFFETYLLHGAWKYGIKGFISSMRFAISTFTILAIKYEEDNNYTLESIEESFLKEKKWLLKYSPKSNFFQKIWAIVVIFFVSKLHKWYKFRLTKF